VPNIPLHTDSGHTTALTCERERWRRLRRRQCGVEPSLSPDCCRPKAAPTSRSRPPGSSPFGTEVPTARHLRLNSALTLIERIYNMSWQKITLTNSQVAIGHLEHISNQYLPIMVKTGKPGLASPLISDSSKDGITTVYFPPEVVSLWVETLSKYGSTPCEAPTEKTTPFVRLNQSSK
jgi:hypothetical protein